MEQQIDVSLFLPSSLSLKSINKKIKMKCLRNSKRLWKIPQANTGLNTNCCHNKLIIYFLIYLFNFLLFNYSCSHFPSLLSLALTTTHFKNILFIYFYREGKGGRETLMCKKDWLPLAHPQTGDLALNPGMCPDWESTWWPFDSQAGARIHWATPARAKLIINTPLVSLRCLTFHTFPLPLLLQSSPT